MGLYPSIYKDLGRSGRRKTEGRNDAQTLRTTDSFVIYFLFLSIGKGYPHKQLKLERQYIPTEPLQSHTKFLKSAKTSTQKERRGLKEFVTRPSSLLSTISLPLF